MFFEFFVISVYFSGAIPVYYHLKDTFKQDGIKNFNIKAIGCAMFWPQIVTYKVVDFILSLGRNWF